MKLVKLELYDVLSVVCEKHVEAPGNPVVLNSDRIEIIEPYRSPEGTPKQTNLKSQLKVVDGTYFYSTQSPDQIYEEIKNQTNP